MLCVLLLVNQVTWQLVISNNRKRRLYLPKRRMGNNNLERIALIFRQSLTTHATIINPLAKYKNSYNQSL